MPNITVPTFQLGDCEHYDIAMEFPRESLEALIPPAFAVQGMTDQTGSVNLALASCARSINDTASLGASYIFRAFAYVRPVNETWTQGPMLNFWLLAGASDNLHFVQAMQALSIPTVTASFSLEEAELPDGSFLAMWSMEADAWTARLDFPWNDYPPHEQELTREAHYWTGSGPFIRFSFNALENVVGSTTSQGEFVITGENPLVEAMQSPANAYLGTYSRPYTEHWKLDGEWNAK